MKVAKINTPVADDLSSTLTSFTQNMAIEDTQVWPLSDQPITGLPHAHALCMTQHVVRIVYMPPVRHLSPHCPDQNHEMHEIWSVDSQENY